MIWTADSVEYRSRDCKAAYSGTTVLWVKNTTPVAKVASEITTSSTYVFVTQDNKIAVTDDLLYTTSTIYSYSAPETQISLQEIYKDAQGRVIGYIPPNALKVRIDGNYIKEASSGYYLNVDEQYGHGPYMCQRSGRSFVVSKNVAREDKIVTSVYWYNLYYLISSGGGAYTSYAKNWIFNDETIGFAYLKNFNHLNLIPQIYEVL